MNRRPVVRTIALRKAQDATARALLLVSLLGGLALILSAGAAWRT